MANEKRKSRHQVVSGEMVEADRGLYLRYGGREHLRIEREMRRIGGGTRGCLIMKFECVNTAYFRKLSGLLRKLRSFLKNV